VKIRELKQALATALAAAEAINAAVPAGSLMTAEQRTEFDEHMTKADTLKGDIDRAEKLAAAQRNTPSIEVGIDHATEKPWGSFKEMLKAVHKHAISGRSQTDPRLFAATGGSESVDSEGGFIVPTEFSSQVWQRAYQTGEILQRCFEQPMSSNRLVIPAVDEDSRVDGSRWGGVQSYYLNEAGTYTGTKPKFRRMELIAHKLIALTYATDELLDDGPAFASYLNNVVPQELKFRAEDNIINGPGAGAPLGVLNSGALITVAKDAADSGVTFTTADALAMWGRMWAPSRATSVWIHNQDVEPKLLNMVRGSGVAVEFMYTPPGKNGNPYGMMMNRPCIPVEYSATLGTVGDIILADFSQYCLATKGEAKMDVSIHVAFLTGEQAFRWQVRHDGQPFWKKPLTPKNGSNTLSPFIACAARS
jgi:HK97 family phage major capsid protein